MNALGTINSLHVLSEQWFIVITIKNVTSIYLLFNHISVAAVFLEHCAYKPVLLLLCLKLKPLKIIFGN